MFMDKNDWSDDDLGDDVGDTLVVPMPTPQVLSSGGHSQYVFRACLSDAPVPRLAGRRRCFVRPEGGPSGLPWHSFDGWRAPDAPSCFAQIRAFSTSFPHVHVCLLTALCCLQGCARGQ